MPRPPAEKASIFLPMYVGLAFNYKMEYRDEYDTPVDMTAWVGRLDARESVTAEAIAFTCSTEDDTLILSSDGVIELIVALGDVPDVPTELVGHLVIGPSPETAKPLAFIGFRVQPTTTPAAP